ncbi:MAG TPA: alpha-amylase family glycosyl hydrolase, partial [Candidatus Limnocylindrales bacterium]
MAASDVSPASMADAAPPAYPTLFQLNTRVYLTSLGRELGRLATLDDIPDAELDRLAGLGFDWVWLLSVWRTGPASRAISLSDPALRAAFEATLPDLTDDDIGGSGFAIAAYEVSPALGGDAALTRLRSRMAARGLRLMLDFVPNHMALDHPWASLHPERFVQGTEADLLREPRNWTTVTTEGEGEFVLAHGRDPYFPGWTDTLQLDYGNPATVEAMTAELASVAARCDGVRCDMAMLLLPDVFDRTWGHPALPFWPEAIRRARAVHPGFVLMAEVYWDLEWTMLGDGFDLAYDKRLYDRLVASAAGPVRDHLR